MKYIFWDKNCLFGKSVVDHYSQITWHSSNSIFD